MFHISEIKDKLTRKEFLGRIGNGFCFAFDDTMIRCPSGLGLTDYKLDECRVGACKSCWEKSIKDIMFKGDDTVTEQSIGIQGENEVLVIKVRYDDPDLFPIEYIEGDKSDWFDLRCAAPGGVTLKAGDYTMISLGVAMKLPEGYEAHIAPRGSTYKSYGIIQTNSVGVVDNKYSGNNDIWKMPVLAMRDTFIPFNDRICQFRIMKKMGEVALETVDKLDGPDRGGFGHTGRR